MYSSQICDFIIYKKLEEFSSAIKTNRLTRKESKTKKGNESIKKMNFSDD